MEPIVVDGKEYYSAKVVAELWGLKEKTIKNYTCESNRKIFGAIKHEGDTLIPADAIRPITKPVAQGLMWGIIGVKNDPNSFLDLSEFNIDNNQLHSVLLELERQQYVILDKGLDDVRGLLLSARVSKKGFDLIRYKKKMSANSFTGALAPQNIASVFSVAQTVMQIVQTVRSF